MPYYGVDQIIKGNKQTGDPPPGWATIIYKSGISIDKIDAYVTGWSNPTYMMDSTTTSNPVESGAIITDHIVANPYRISMTGNVSDISMGSDATGRTWEYLRKLHKEHAIVKIITEWGTFNNMAIIAISSTQTNRGMEFNIDTQQIIQAGISESNPIETAKEQPNNPAANRQPNTPQGEKQPQKPNQQPQNNVIIPVIPRGDGTFIAQQPDGTSKIIKFLTDDQGNPVRNQDGTKQYIEIPPAQE